MIGLDWLAVGVALALGTMALTLASNALFLPRLTTPTNPPAHPRPKLSILIPARNEAGVITETLNALARVVHLHLEILVLDDASTDATVQEIAAARTRDGRIRLLTGKPLPSGWLGKNWACYQLAEAAAGDELLFLDADVLLAPTAIDALQAMAAGTQADLLTIWPTQVTVSWGERLTIPLIALAIHTYLPALGVHHLPFPALAAANGQCLLFQRAAYEAIGDHTAVRSEVLDDVNLARLIKRDGHRLRMAEGAGLVSCRMYRNGSATRAGLAKNILAGHAHSRLFLLASTLFHWLVYIGPWLWLAAGGGRAALLLGGVGLALRMASAALSGQRRRDAFLMPLSVLLMTVIAAQALIWSWRGGGQWKGRPLPTARPL